MWPVPSRTYILIGIAAFAVFGAAFMPASVVRLATDRIDGLTLRTASGTLWDGNASVAVGGHAIGSLTWTFEPLGLLEGEARMRWQLRDATIDLAGVASRGFDAAWMTAAGTVDSAAANRILGRYDISIGGAFKLVGLGLRLDEAGARASGEIRWSGGRTLYRLSGQNYDTTLPAMLANVATVEGKHTLWVELADDVAPSAARARLMDAHLDASGWLRVGLTRRFLVLAGKPWPIPGDENATVLSVEEQVLRDRGPTTP